MSNILALLHMNIGIVLYTLTIIALTCFTIFIFFNKISNTYFSIKRKYLLLQRYWSFIIFFVLFEIIGYFLIITYISFSEKQLWIDIFGQISGLIFAIFVGYFAYRQFIEYKFDKYKEESNNYIKSKEYHRAIITLEQCISINGKDFNTRANLMEIYLIKKQFNLFDEKLEDFNICIVENSEKIIYHLLIVSKYIVREHLSEAKQEILNIIQIIQHNPKLYEILNWNFNDMKDSDTYQQLGSHAKEIYENLSKYLNRELSVEEKTKFENGEYELL